MRTTAPALTEADIIDARLLALHAEKARIDAEIAAAAEDLRRLIENRMLHSSASGECAKYPAKRRQTNFADTSTASSIACLLRISERAAHSLVQYGNALVNYYPDTLAALYDGHISWQHASTIINECTGVPDGASGLLETELLTLAKDSTTTRLARRARKIRTQLHPDTLDTRARTANEHRRVDLSPCHDGMAWLNIYLPATDATAIDAHLIHAARALQTPTERRTLPQLRTDVLTDLLLASPGVCTHHTPSVVGAAGDSRAAATDQSFGPVTTVEEAGSGAHRAARASTVGGAAVEAGGCVGDCGGRGGVRAHVNVTVPVLTLLGVDDEPADLEGYGPIPADVARRLAAHAPSFTRILTHPETGTVLSVGRTSYAVPADLKKWLRVRDQTCRHPGCSMPASRCEIDHTTPWSHNGPTNHDNLAHLCRKHHKLKSEGIWRYTQQGTGTLIATSPTGRTYTSELEPPPF